MLKMALPLGASTLRVQPSTYAWTLKDNPGKPLMDLSNSPASHLSRRGNKPGDPTQSEAFTEST